jgi:hypothetical protein
MQDRAVVATDVERYRLRVRITSDRATRRATFRTAVWRIRRLPFRIIQVGGVVLAVAGVVLAPFGGSYLSWTLGLGGLLWIVAPALAVHRMLRAYDGVQRPLMTYEIDETGVTVSDDVKNLRYGWAAFTSTELLSDQVLFRIGRLSFVHLPTTTMSDEQVSAVEKLARQSGVPVRTAQ